MRMTLIKEKLSFFLCIVLIAAMALFTTGCSDSKNKGNSETANISSVSASDTTVLGEGKTVFTFIVADKEGNEQQFEIHTDKTTVGDALLELELISGDEGDYGLYVKTVNGIRADYDKDGVYWAFYVNGEYAVSGVDSTNITEGAVYSFRVE